MPSWHVITNPFFADDTQGSTHRAAKCVPKLRVKGMSVRWRVYDYNMDTYWVVCFGRATLRSLPPKKGEPLQKTEFSLPMQLSVHFQRQLIIISFFLYCTCISTQFYGNSSLHMPAFLLLLSEMK